MLTFLVVLVVFACSRIVVSNINIPLYLYWLIKIRNHIKLAYRDYREQAYIPGGVLLGAYPYGIIAFLWLILFVFVILFFKIKYFDVNESRRMLSIYIAFGPIILCLFSCGLYTMFETIEKNNRQEKLSKQIENLNLHIDKNSVSEINLYRIYWRSCFYLELIQNEILSQKKDIDHEIIENIFKDLEFIKSNNKENGFLLRMSEKIHKKISKIKNSLEKRKIK